TTHLPTHMIPTTITPLPTLPTTPNGKLDPTRLPPPAAPLQQPTGKEPRDAIETGLVELFREVLPQRPVGIDDSFFDLGGDSLLAMRLMARVRRAFGVDLRVGALLEAPTVEQLAVAVVEELLNEVDPEQVESLLTGQEEESRASAENRPGQERSA
ncbi:phosphopantetheine-binding protein, partial [Streptomyces sp. NPDC006739]|uniref:phosphopantetheine-binding protein n=1 Tax=Streptomyces sp. NPDC006739 TaxID=3364763 RepID=UPI0036B715B1